MAGCIQKLNEGIRISIHVQPKSSKTGWGNTVESEGNQWIQLRITAPPVDGAANKAIVKFLAKEFKTAKSNIELIQGEKSRFKTFLLEGVNEERLQVFLDRFHLQL